ncbi:unnamed protein product [Eruca vesicaria subsp. sativa]|uniref:TATA box-binding protein-associated factor RNA polymerase I subunit B n=1 Tax=Eruca vesicaria subsp. sativa TaxID=29727 RepID=A0ABC8J2V1_ERUVS|nr:unnamed protein product [Eruca vesicaria subsp. sativa]
MESNKMICDGCENNTFEEEDGFFYCLNCGDRAADIIATVADDEDIGGEGRVGTYSQANTRRLATQPTATPSHPEETNRYSQFRSQLKSATKTPQQPTRDDIGAPTDPEDFGGEAVPLSYEDCYQQTRERYASGLIMMMTYQCDALVDKFYVTPLIIGLVPEIFLRFLAVSGAFDQDWADNAIRDSELQSQETNGEVRESKKRSRKKGKGDDSEHRSFDGKRAVMIWLSQLRNSLPLSSSLAISFLACHNAGAPVLPTDIVRWAREGKLPYQSCFVKIQEQMGERTAACPVGASVMFSPDEILSAHKLEAQAASIADVIGLVLPPVNFYAIALNYLKRLSVPEDKVVDLVRLIHYWAMPSEIYLSKSQHRLPSRVCVMSVLVVAIRMLYNINGFGMWEQSLDDAAASETEESGDDDGELTQVKKATEFDTKELMKTLERKYYELDAETNDGFETDLLSYLSHGKNEIFAGLEAASADDTYRTVGKLWNSYQKVDEESETPIKRGRDTPCSSNATTSETRSMEPSLEYSPSPDHHDEEDGSKERAISRLIADMGENFFVYIPPRVKVKRQGYIQYVRKKEDGALTYAVHADYYILLRVCARVAEIDARNMHRGVLSFERRLAWIEKRIDHVLHQTPSSSFMTCKHCDDVKLVVALFSACGRYLTACVIPHAETGLQTLVQQDSGLATSRTRHPVTVIKSCMKGNLSVTSICFPGVNY